MSFIKEKTFSRGQNVQSIYCEVKKCTVSIHIKLMLNDMYGSSRYISLYVIAVLHRTGYMLTSGHYSSSVAAMENVQNGSWILQYNEN